jgi:osmoprotectant transport system ATP-binding protein
MTRARVELLGVEKRFGDTVALRPTSLSIPAGSTTALVGPSGSGKSTILRLLVGLIAPTAGEIRYDGIVLSAANLRDVRHRIGYVIQEGGLFPHLTVRDNVLLLGRHLGKSPEYLGGRFSELCALTRFPAGAVDRYPGELSGGQRQRVGLMRALLLEPDVLLMDEPMGALDPIVRAELQEEFREIFARLAPTVVLVTHDLAEAADLGHRLVLLHDGRVVQEGTLEDLRERPSDPFVTRFFRAQRGIRA